ncbi:MAG: GPW/gp25 family protein [Mariniphaga sp.]|nr:GPW/gp25 family protein [Mariniphaga sp.]
MNKQEQSKCSLTDSVAGLIHLIAVTSYGECKHDISFGCEIWEHDFENIANSQIFREKLRSSIQNTIEKHEPRLTNVKVGIQIDQIDYRMDRHRIKSRIRLKVDAILVMTNESFTFTDQFFIGPLSYY